MKKLITLTLIAVIGSSAALFTGCNKYEDGPMISLRSKKARMINVWKEEKIVYKSGTTVTPTSPGTMELKEDGGVAFNGSSSTAVKWQFSSDKESLEIVTTIGTVSSTTSSKILRLTNDELVLQDTDGDKSYFVSQ